MTTAGKYNKEFAEQALKLCYMGATDLDLANFFEVCIQTIWNWRATHREFADAVNKVSKEFADKRVERSLYQRAVGYTYDAVKIFNGPEGVVKVPYREHMPPDPVSCIFWLKNRRREEWRDAGPAANNLQDNRNFTITIGNAKIGNGKDHTAELAKCIEHMES